MIEAGAKVTGKYRLEVEPLDLGADVKAIGLELIDAEGEPVKGAEGAAIWARVLVALAATEKWVLDFFAHVPRVAEYCAKNGIAYREAGTRCVVVTAPEGEKLEEMLARFEGELFGARAGEKVGEADGELEGELSKRGVDGYHGAYRRYFFCGVCDFENGFLTVLTEKLWASEVIRRVRPVVKEMGVETYLPQ